MRRTIMLQAAISAVLLATAIARGDAASSANDAQNGVANVDNRLGQHAGELQNVQKQLDQQTDALGDLAKRLGDQLDANKKLAPLIDAAMTSSRADLDAARGEFNAREQTVRACQNAMTLARDASDKARAAANQAAADERKAFATSPAFTAATAKVDAAVADVARLEKELDQKVKLDVRAAKLAAELKPLEQKVAALRAANPIDQAALADASAAWIAAKSAAETARRDVFARSLPYADAQKAIRDARKAVNDQQAEFDRSILMRPGVAEAQLAAQAATFAVKEAETELAAAQKDQDRAASAVADRKASLDQLARLKDGADGKLADLRQDVSRMQVTLVNLSQQLQARVADALSLRQDLAGVANSINTIIAELAKGAGGPKKK